MATKVPGRHKNWQKVEVNALDERDSAVFVTVATLTTKPLRAGKHRVQWKASARLKSPGSTSDIRMQAEKDSVQMDVHEFISPNNRFQTWSGWDFFTFADGDTPVFTLDIRRVGGSDIVEFQKLKISIELMEE